MGRWIIIFFLLIIVLYFILHYYIGKKGLTVFRPNKRMKIGYWALLYFLAISFIIGRLGNEIIPLAVSSFLSIIGSYWLGLLLYLGILFVFVDLLNLFARVLKVKENKLVTHKKVVNITIIAISTMLVIYGGYNARQSKVIKYSIDINKSVENIEQMKVVMISDLHLGQIVGDRFLRSVVKTINSLEPDLILIPGDIIDDNLRDNIHKNMKDILRELDSTFGVYASMGNHEFIGGQADEIEAFLNEANIVVLRDEALKIEGSFYVIGREDKATERFTNQYRKELAEIMVEVDRTNPVFMMDHQPIDIFEARSEGVDLQVSGHTHKGQVLPGRFFTNRIFDVDWGLYKEGSYHLIVTSGVGTWGPPIRVGTKSEIVLINVSLN